MGMMPNFGGLGKDFPSSMISSASSRMLEEERQRAMLAPNSHRYTSSTAAAQELTERDF